MSRRSISVPKNEEKPLSSTHLHIKNGKHQGDKDDHQARTRCLSSSPSIIKGKCTGLSTASTSSLLGDLVLKADDVIKLKENLRKTGFIEGNQTLRRKTPQESFQMDFRSILRPSRKSLPVNTN